MSNLALLDTYEKNAELLGYFRGKMIPGAFEGDLLLVAAMCFLAERIEVEAPQLPGTNSVSVNWLAQEYTRLVVGEFLRGFENKEFALYTMPSMFKKTVKRHIRLEAQLWGHLWRLVKLLPSLPVPKHLFFLNLIDERELVLFCFPYEERVESLTATALVNKIRSQNRQIQNLDDPTLNPFNKEVSPFTWSFVEALKRRAASNRDSERDYRRFVDLRMEMTAMIRESRPKIHSDTRRPERRGRKSRNLSLKAL